MRGRGCWSAVPSMPVSLQPFTACSGRVCPMPRDDAVRQRLLAISYVLPPVLAPQSIQIGRLLAHLDMDIATVSGPLEAQGPVLEGELVRRTALRIEAKFEPP